MVQGDHAEFAPAPRHRERRLDGVEQAQSLGIEGVDAHVVAAGKQRQAAEAQSNGKVPCLRPAGLDSVHVAVDAEDGRAVCAHDTHVNAGDAAVARVEFGLDAQIVALGHAVRLSRLSVAEAQADDVELQSGRCGAAAHRLGVGRLLALMVGEVGLADRAGLPGRLDGPLAQP